MATVNFQLDHFCGGSGHATINLTLGPRTRTVTLDRDYFRAPIEDDELEAFAKVVLRVLGQGKTDGQIAAALQAGVDVVI